MSLEKTPGRTLVILVADDDPVSRMVVSGLLRRAGHDVDTAIDGIEAVEAAMRRRYDLVLMDLQMPELDGCEASRRIRDTGGLGLRIVALTASVDDEIRMRCRDAGIDSVAAKPVDGATLEAIVAGVPPRAGVPVSERDDEDLSATEFARFRRDVGAHMSRTFQEVVEGILATMRRQARSMRDAAAHDDRLEVARIAHMLRASAATLGARVLVGRAAALERDAATLPLERLRAETVAASDDLDRAARRASEELESEV